MATITLQGNSVATIGDLPKIGDKAKILIKFIACISS